MAAKLATVEDRNAAALTESDAIGSGSTIPRGGSKPQVGGIQFDCGYLSPYFVTDPERMEVVFQDVYILVHKEKISTREDLRPLLEQIAQSGRPLLIIAEDVESEALATLVVTKLRGPLRVAAVRAPGSGDSSSNVLQDIALLTGAKAISESHGLSLRDIQMVDLGQARKITIDKSRTVIEGRAKYAQLTFVPGPTDHLYTCTSPALLSS